MARTASRTPARRPRRILGLDEEQRQAERRRLLLEAALELFGTRGYAKTPVEILCQTAAVGTNSFYELFTNKEAVLIALYDQISTHLRDGVAEAYVENRDDSDVVRALVDRFVHEAVDDPRVARVAFIEAAGVSAAMEEHRRHTRDSFVEGLEAIGRDLRDAAVGPPGARAPVRPGPSPRRNAVALVGAIIETTVDWLHDPDPDPIEQLIDDIAHHCRRVMVAIIEESAPPRARARR